jgi:RNA polymerase sigma-70 factor (ECF subfamily)
MELRALVEAPPLRARTTDPDAALVAAAREQPQAFLALYDRYFDRVLGYARLRIRDESTCEDIASTVFTTALEQIRRFRGDGTFAGWLFQIARNTVRDVQRRPAAVPLPAEGTVSEPDLEQRLLAHELSGTCARWSDSSNPSSDTCSRCATEPASPSTRSARSSAPLLEQSASACTDSRTATQEVADDI